MEQETNETASQGDAVLSIKSASKRFGSVLALDGVDFSLSKGEIHALMGENGAGKSTLLKVLTGVYARDEGAITLSGKPFNPQGPAAAQLAGVSTVYQEVNLIPHLTIAENILLGRQNRRFGFINPRAENKRARNALTKLGLDIDVNQVLGACSVAIQQMTAIARGLDCDAQVLILDEPTSSLDTQEVERLFTVMKKLREDGIGIIFVTHFLDQVYEVSDRITILRNGKLEGTYMAADLPKNLLVQKMLGRELQAEEASHAPGRSAATQPRDSIVSTRGIKRKNSIESTDLEIRSGEVLGIAGLLGSGRTELARIIFGIDSHDHGDLYVHGETHRSYSPRQAVRDGLAFCSEDRKTEGIIPEMSVRENMILAMQGRKGWLSKISSREQRRLAEHYIKALRIATPDSEKPVGQLSGGNQQKVLLARWLLCKPDLLILDEPTRGIDIGAKGEIMRLVDSLCAEGMAVVFISAELEETLRCCHRVAVMRQRSKIAELAGDQLTAPNLMSLMAQGTLPQERAN